MSWIHPRDVGFWTYFRRHGLRTLVLISAAMFLMEHLGWLHRMEMAGLDSFVRFRAPEHSDQIVLVEITEENYTTLFGAKSPLDAATLGRLIGNIRTAGPKLIAVDVDTSDPSFRVLAKPGAHQWSEVIWARVPAQPKGRRRLEHPHLSELRDVAGGLVTDARRIGLPVFPVDSDGVVRKYRRQFETSYGRIPSLSWVVARRYDPQLEARGDEAIFNFAGDRYTFPIIQASEFMARPSEAWKALKDKIVLVGGDYGAARDTYMTALGEMAGVELIAHAVQSDLSNGGIRTSNFIVSLAMDLLFGTLLVYVFFRLKLGPAFAIGMLALVPLCLIGSWISFNTATYWISFVPIVLGMIVHQVWDYAQEQRQELERLRGEVAHLRQREVSAPRIRSAP